MNKYLFPGNKKISLSSNHLEWLSLLRVFSAFQVVGFHWLRACLDNKLISNKDLSNNFKNIIKVYKNNGQGLKIFENFPSHFMIDSGNGLLSIFNNILGLFFEFGWEVVSTFILISGFSLTLQFEKGLKKQKYDWISWYKKRLSRILGPYYFLMLFIVSTVLILYFCSFFVHFKFFELFTNKINRETHGNWLSLLLSHLFLFDFSSPPNFKAEFIVDAWWFISPILVVYLAFPILIFALDNVGNRLFTLIGFITSVLFYYLKFFDLAIEQSYLYGVGFQLFNFALGMVLARLYTGHKINEHILGNKLTAGIGVLFFCIGNFMNWFNFLYPFSSLFYTFGFTSVATFFSVNLIQCSFFSWLSKIDSYILYLIHQPIAHAIVWLLIVILKSLDYWITFLGFPIYLGFTLIATHLFAKLYLRILQKV